VDGFKRWVKRKDTTAARKKLIELLGGGGKEFILDRIVGADFYPAVETVSSGKGTDMAQFSLGFFLDATAPTEK